MSATPQEPEPQDARPASGDPYAEDAARAQQLSHGIAGWLGKLRAAAEKHPGLRRLHKIIITVLGSAIVVIGLILVPLPGPGWLIVFIGLTLLGTEYHWARRLLGWLRSILARFWERWNAWRAARRAQKAERK